MDKSQPPATPAVNKQSAPPAANVIGGYSYPSNFPYDSIKEVVRIVKSNAVATEKSAFGKHIWVVQGYAQAKLLGDPDTQKAAVDFNVIGADQGRDVVVDMLANMLEAHDAQAQSLTPQALADQGGPLIKSSAAAPLSMLLKWSVTQLMILLEQELAAAVI